MLGPARLAAPDFSNAQDIAENASASGSPEDIEAAGCVRKKAPGIIFGVKVQPVLAVVDGVITDVVDTTGRQHHGRSPTPPVGATSWLDSTTTTPARTMERPRPISD